MKKFLLLFMILIFSCSMVFASDYIFDGQELPATSSYTDDFYGVETMKNILDDLGITYDDTTILGYTYYTNQAYNFFKKNYDETISPLNICFAKQSTYTDRVILVVSNGTFSNTQPYMYVDTNYNSTYARINGFVSWNLDSNGNRISANTSSIYILSAYTNKYDIDSTTLLMQKTGFVQDGSTIHYNKLLAPVNSFTTAGYTTTTGYSWYFLGNTIRFTAEPDVDIPSGDDGGDTGGNTGGGTGSTDLTMTNAKIDQLNKHAEEILNKMPSSGDIEQATQNGVVQGSTDYWGSSGDLTGENQENLVSGEIDNLMNSVSGDLAENEIFGILQKYENKIFGGFTGEEDFKISWNDVSYMNATLIPAGEVNFSQICRENEALGNVKTTINIILGFFLLSNCVIYLYNLLLATLGIDNPYLYETPPEEVNTITYDTDMNTGTTTEIRTSKKRDGTTFRTRRKF